MKGKRIYRGFVFKYIIFLIITVLICVLTFIYMGWDIKRAYEQGQIPKIIAKQIIQSDPYQMDLKDVLAMDGWVQVLDYKYRVVYEKGKNSPHKFKYTPEEILSYLEFPYADKYFYTIAFYPESDPEHHLLLTAIPATKININVQPENVPYMVIKPFVDTLIKSGLLFFLMLIINILLYSHFTANNLSKPLGVLLNGIERMAHGERKVHIHLKTGNELEEIGAAFNRMALELEKSRLEKEKMEEIRRQLLMNISHDLKTPLTSIRGYIEALADGMVQDEKTQKKYLRLVKEKTIKVNNLINDLFQLTRLEEDDYKLQFKDYDLAEFLRSWFAHYIPELESQGFEYRVSIPDKEIICHFDPQQLERALTNILMNGIQYNPPGTTISVSLIEKDKEVQIIIEDNGIGIEPEIREKIFLPFVRGDKSRSLSTGGTGLGLAIARQIILKHSGEIRLISEPKKGTIFEITLPL
ncbi:hypothetical protein BBF96_14740 [Anoxybacter fermentans]|uniref:histidine kinase n=1 Tax=Anoxybacter fermentans TaxID=1323375 RepID=A0A3S9T243_9FIRM|nr:HAMP domain-containing sensor histidine kinase [Anoxybacter fermentans]AZR74532.1 hypothetical protein BBF96_14740 [Anoxybacter fermentans]